MQRLVEKGAGLDAAIIAGKAGAVPLRMIKATDEQRDSLAAVLGTIACRGGLPDNKSYTKRTHCRLNALPGRASVQRPSCTTASPFTSTV